MSRAGLMRMDDNAARGITTGFALFFLAAPVWLVVVGFANVLLWSGAIRAAPGLLPSLFGLQLPVYSAAWLRPLAIVQGLMTLSLPGFLSQVLGWMGTVVILLLIAATGIGLLLRQEWARQLAMVVFIFCVLDLPFFLVGADTAAPLAAVPALLPTFLFGAAGFWLFGFTQVKGLFTGIYHRYI